MMSVVIKAHFDGKTIVPDAAVDLPTGEQLEVEVRLVSVTKTRRKRSAASARPKITSLPFFGMWAGREDMQDSTEWVRKEREKWDSRLSGAD